MSKTDRIILAILGFLLFASILLVLLFSESIFEEERIAQSQADSKELVQKMRMDSTEKVSNSMLPFKRKADSIHVVKEANRHEMWQVEHYKDDFGDETNVKFLSTSVGGLYRSDSRYFPVPTSVKIYVDYKAIRIEHSSYDSREMKSIEMILHPATIRMKNSKGEIIEMVSSSSYDRTGSIPSHKIYGIKISNSKNEKKYNYDRFISFLKRSVGEIRVIIYGYDSSTSKFTFDVTGFTEEYNLI